MFPEVMHLGTCPKEFVSFARCKHAFKKGCHRWVLTSVEARHRFVQTSGRVRGSEPSETVASPTTASDWMSNCWGILRTHVKELSCFNHPRKIAERQLSTMFLNHCLLEKLLLRAVTWSYCCVQFTLSAMSVPVAGNSCESSGTVLLCFALLVALFL